MLNGKRTAALGAVAPLGKVFSGAGVAGAGVARSAFARSAFARSAFAGSAFVGGVLLMVALGGCGGSGKGPEDASGAYEPQSTTPWKDKSREQRMDWMGIAVFPKMRKLFLEQDSEKYEDFACQTCHGKDMETVDFKLPNDLFALAKNDTLAQAKEYDEKTTDFMLGAVVPEMAKLLDMDAFTLENQTGFGCLGCHPTTKD